MLLGATPTLPKTEPVAAGAAAEDVEMKDVETKDVEVKKENVLDTDEFWDGLHGWLQGKVDQGEAKRLALLFRKAASGS
jgi:Get5 carboxyl domain